MINYFQKKINRRDRYNTNFIVLQVSLLNNLPIIKENYKKLSEIYEKFLLVIICPRNEYSKFKNNLNQNNIKIIDENEILEKKRFVKIFNQLLKNKKNKKKYLNRINWYFQQFLKINYLLKYKKKIVIWDADTIILKKIFFFKNNHISNNFGNFFEYHKPYFKTIKALTQKEIPINYLSSVNQFLAITPKEIKKIIKKFISIKIYKNRLLLKNIIKSFLKYHEFNHSLFSEYETLGILKMENNNTDQKTIFFLRYKINGQLSLLQKKIAIFFGAIHYTYEGNKKEKKKILSRKFSNLNFLTLIIKNYSKYILRKLQFLFTSKQRRYFN
jgi:hypothetical protein